MIPNILLGVLSSSLWDTISGRYKAKLVLYIFVCTTLSTKQEYAILNQMEATIPWIRGAARRLLYSSNTEPAKTDESKVSRFL